MRITVEDYRKMVGRMAKKKGVPEEAVAKPLCQPAASRNCEPELSLFDQAVSSARLVVRFTVNGDVMGAPRQSRRDAWKPRPCVLRYREMCDRIRAAAGEIPELPGFAFARFFIPMPDSWTDKKKAKMAGTDHRQTPDADNCKKALLDALIENDGCVFGICAFKVWCRRGEERIEASLFYYEDPNQQKV